MALINITMPNPRTKAAKENFYMPPYYSRAVPPGTMQEYVDKRRASGKPVTMLSTYSNHRTGQFFYTTGHLFMHYRFMEQRGFVACSSVFPQDVVPRKGLEDGYVDTVAKFDFVYHRDMTEIDPYALWPELSLE